MRAYSALLLLSLVGCESLWGSYIGFGDFVLDGGSQECEGQGTCDLGGTDGPSPDLVLPGCTSDTICAATATPYCDLNTGQCTDVQPPTMAFPQVAPFVSQVLLAKRYMLMTTGDYNNDGITDIAVAGVFTGSANANPNSANATNAMAGDMEVYLGDGRGGFAADTPCSIPNSDAPVHLLTVPAPGKTYQGVLVATMGPRVYYCARVPGANGTWSATMVGSSMVPTGFKQLALSNDAGQSSPDLIIRTSKNLFLETVDPSTQGSLDVRRTNGNYVFTGMPSQASSTGITAVTPVNIKGTTPGGDRLALAWDDPGPGSKRGLEFYYTDSNFATNSVAYTVPVFMTGTFFPDLAKPLRTTALLRSTSANPLIVLAVSQQPNYFAVLSGATFPGFALVGQIATTTATGLIQVYTGDADGDRLDEIGLYSLAINGLAAPQNLQLFSFKGNAISATPLADIPHGTDNFRGMALEYLGLAGDRRRDALRKDLIALIENKTGSQLLISRANLNYRFP